MAGKTIWKGFIHFRAFDVPVKLHPAVKEERMQFHLLHRRDHVKLKQMFHGWTDEGIMRQPVFLRLREEMAAREVVRH
jgi:non-homologous end joining protein Ku